MDRRTFWATKSPLQQFEAIVFEHPAFDSPIRLVADVFEEVMLGGFLHTPAPMSIRPPERNADAQPKLVLSFPRAVVGREFKRQLGLIIAAGSRDPIEVTYGLYLGDTTAPQATWNLYASEKGGVSFGADVVQVTATLDNPMRRPVAVLYDPAVFTGLAAL